MAIHGDKDTFKAVHWFKKKLIKPFLNRIHKKYKEKLKELEEEGWHRSSTPRVKEALEEATQSLNKDKSLVKALDIFLVIYDTDDAYADMFHRFVEKCNKDELHLEQGEMYLDKDPAEKLESEWHHLMRLNPNRLDYLIKKAEKYMPEKKYKDIREEKMDLTELSPEEKKEMIQEMKNEVEEH